MFLITSNTFNTSQVKSTFEKTFFVELNVSEDSMLFRPYSKAWVGNWNSSSSISIDGSELMDYNEYKSSFLNRGENLFTILHPLMVDGSVQLYSPYNPKSFIQLDEGEMLYPLLGENESFVNSEKARRGVSEVLGFFGEFYDMPLMNVYGEDSLREMADGTFEYAYPPREFFWHKDSDIIKFKLRVTVLLNNKGKEKGRIINSICPVVNRLDPYTGEVLGEKELCWLNFEDIKKTLKKHYFFDKGLKPISYLDYLLARVGKVSL